MAEVEARDESPRDALLDLGGVGIAVSDPAGILVGKLTRLYGHRFRAPRAGLRASLSFEVSGGARRPTEPPDDPLLHMVLDRPLRGWLMHGGLWLSDGRNATWVDYDEGYARMDVAVTDEAALFVLAHHVFPMAVGELLRTQGRYALHGAAIERSDASGVLVLGDSGEGKSTLTYRSLALGHRCVADDGVMLHVEGERVVATPFYRELCLDPAMLADEDRGRAVPIEPALDGPRHRVELPVEAWSDGCPIDAVWLLRREGATVSRREPALASAVLAELVRQNRRILLHPDLAPGHLAALSLLTGTAAGWVVNIGSDILTSDRALEGLFAP